MESLSNKPNNTKPKDKSEFVFVLTCSICFFMQMMGGADNQIVCNSLLRSGLLFAGANRAWTNENVISGIEDGILTAEEISNLNLSGTKLVVLSACETGLGEVQNSEGVFGLQRAFKLAGIETLVMSLWKVVILLQKIL